ncbi:F-box only protein, partial [Halocaridina rubra]
VCRRFNQINMSLLNKGFRRVERYQAKCLKEVKSQLPRRESERRNHALFRHCDILTAIETRLSLLNMTFMKYADCQMCCFIPGKVIDEIYRVLRFVQSNKTLPKPHEILTELRDISSMAMEHFEEKIIRTLKTTPVSSSSQRFSLSSNLNLLPISSDLSLYTSGSSSAISSTPGTSSLSKSLRYSPNTPDDAQFLVASNVHKINAINGLKKEVSELKSKIHDLRRKVSEQERVALEQNRLLSEQTTKLISQGAKLNEVNRKLLEYDQRFTEVLAELSRVREESTARSSSGVSGLNWQTDDKASKYYVSHTVTSSPALGSTLFVAGSMMQPNFVPLNLAAAQMSHSPYLTSSQLGTYSGGIAYSMDPAAADPSPSSSGVYSASSSKANLEKNVSQSESQSSTVKETSSSRSSNTEMRPPKAPLKKHSKRKVSSDAEGSQETTYLKKMKKDEP